MASYNSIKEASDAYFAAKKRGDAAGMQAANNAANEIRKSQGQKPQYATQDINNTRKSMGGLIGSLVNAMGNIGNAITGGSRPSGGSSGGGTSRPAGGTTGSWNSALDALQNAVHNGLNGGKGSATGVGTFTDEQNAIKNQMNANSLEWHSATPERKKELEAMNKALAYRLGGSLSFDPKTGRWNGTADEPLQMPQMDIPGYEEWLGQSGFGSAMDSMSAANDAYLQQMEADAAAQKAQLQQEFDDAARRAYIANMESRRTLPQRMSAAGMNGGLADSQEIALDAELQNNQAQLDNGRASALQQLQNILSQNKLTAQQNYLGNLAGLQQNAAAGYQDFYRNTADRILQNFYSQQELAQATEQQKWDRAYALLQSMGYADDKIAQILGVAPGTATMDRDLAEAQLQMQMGKPGLL